MKGKIAFVLGAAVGYVLGTRAGRERYEQIRRGAVTVWNTEPVQRSVTLVRDVLDDKADDVKAFVRRASSDAFANLAKQTSEPRTSNDAKTGTARTSSQRSTASSKKQTTKKQSAAEKQKSARSEGKADGSKGES